MPFPVTDSFPTPGSLSGNWSNGTVFTDPITINAAGQCYSPIAASAYWSANVFTNDQYSEITVGALASDTGSWFGPIVRMGASGNGYVLEVQGSLGNLYLNSLSGLSGTYLGGSYGTASAGSIVGVSAVGTTISVILNGTTLGTVTDSTWTSGSAGIGGSNDLGPSFNGYWSFFQADDIPTGAPSAPIFMLGHT